MNFDEQQRKILWQERLRTVPDLNLRSLSGPLFVLIPHPDDEVLGCGGFLQAAAHVFEKIELVYVTDGEAAFGKLRLDEGETLKATRRKESQDALEALQLSCPIRLHFLELPDAGLTHEIAQLSSCLRDILSPGATVLAPLERDGHPDHDCLGRVARDLAGPLNLRLYLYPVWMWFRLKFEADLVASFYKLHLDDLRLERKQNAIACFKSQIHEDRGQGLVLDPEFVELHRYQKFEFFLRVEESV